MKKHWLIAILALLSILSFYLVAHQSSRTQTDPKFTLENSENTAPKTRPSGQGRDWEKIKKDLQADLELSQDDVPWDKIEPFIKKLLTEDEEKTLQLLTALTGNINHFALRLILEDHYLGKNRSDRTKLSEAIAALNILKGNETLVTPLVEKFLGTYSETDLQGSHDWLIHNTDISGIESAALAVGKNAGNQANPQTHFNLITSPETPTSLRGPYLQGLLQSWTEKDLGSALTHLSKANLSPEFDPAIYGIISNIKSIDPANTMLWAQSITDPGLRQSAVFETAFAWSEEDPNAYATWKKDASLSSQIREELP